MHDKIYNWNCPYCDGLAKGFPSYLFDNVKFNRSHQCAFCDNYYRVGIEKDGTFRILANMETYTKYLAKLALEEWKWINVGRFPWCHNRVKELLAEKLGWIGSLTGLLQLDNL